MFIKYTTITSSFYLAWLQFLIKFRRTAIGPLWLLISPALFIFILGALFSKVSNIDPVLFIPHLTIGYIYWTLLNGFVTGSTTIFQRSRAQILQSGISISELVTINTATVVLQFMHQIILIVVVMIYYQSGLSVYSFTSIAGLVLLIVNGYWLGMVFGIIGARYRDLAEITQAVMRIAFLATPIIWMPGDTGRGGVVGIYLNLNPFYHFLEIFRAPLLGQSISSLSWVVVIAITVVGFAISHLFYKRYHKQLPLWV